MFVIPQIRRRLAALAVCLLLLLAGCRRSPAPPPENALTVTVLDVGKADCILLTFGKEAMLIDTGTADSADTVLACLRRQGVTTLKLLLLTHPDKDHIGGVPGVLEAVRPDRVVQADTEKDSGAYALYETALAERGLTPVRLREPLELALGGATVRLAPGIQTSYKQSNDYSILTEVSIGRRRFLFAGDAEKERIHEYLDTKPGKVDFLKVPHHGQKEKNSPLFFRTAAPEYAVVTCSKEEPPDDEVLDALRAVDARILLTDGGTVTAVSDGDTLRVTQT